MSDDLYSLFVKEAVVDLEKQSHQAQFYNHYQFSDIDSTEGIIYYVRRFAWKVYDYDITHPYHHKKVVARFDPMRIVSVSSMKITHKNG